MLSNIVKGKLRENLSWCFAEAVSHDSGEFVVTEEDRKFFREKLGVVHLDSAFVDYYTIVAFPPASNHGELFTLDMIFDALEEDEGREAAGMADFLRISSAEGEGSYYYNKKNDHVYDVSWGSEDSLASGELKPLSQSFSEFLDWFYT